MEIAEVLFRLVFENTVLIHTNTTLYVPSVLFCGSHCRAPVSSFFFHKETGRCVLSDYVHLKNAPGMKPEEKWTYYQNEKGSGPCFPGYRRLPSVDMCVKFVTTETRYRKARADCEAVRGGRVVHLDTADKIAVIRRIHKAEYGQSSFYIGLNYQSKNKKGDFHWTDGTSLNASNWYDGQPDNRRRKYHCVKDSYKSNYKWEAISCRDRVSYICEISQ